MAVADAHDSRAVPPGAATPDSPTLQIPVRVELPAEETPTPSAPPPRAVGRYLVEEEIGRGGMGVVYRAFDRDLRRRVAMKVLQGALGGDRDLVERFAEEAQATAQLQHPGIVPVYDVGVDGSDRLYFTMKLVRGRTLARIVEQARGAGDAATAREFTLFRLLQVYADVARTIAYAHARGVVHRDLKPQNIMVGGFGEVLVMDWGLAKVLGRDDDDRPRARDEPTSGITTAGARAETQAGALVGTPAYMAPEQAQGHGGRAVGPLADIYALGATLYHVLTGRTPFEGSPSAEVVARVLTVEPPRPRALVPKVPREVEAICLRAMAKAPGDRYPSARALADDVQAFLEGRPVAACPDGPLGRAAKWARRHRSLTATAAVALVLGLAGAVAALVVIDGQRRAAVAAKAGEERARRMAEDERRVAEEERRAAERSRAQAEDLLAFMLFDLRDRLAAIGRTDVLEPVARRAKASCEAAPEGSLTPLGKRLHGVSLTTLAVIHEGRGEFDQADVHYRAAVRVLAAIAVGPPEALDDLAIARLGMGRMHEVRGRHAEASESVRRAITTLEALVAGVPEVPAFRQRLAEAYMLAGHILHAEGRLEEAFSTYREGLAIAEALAAEAPGDRYRLGFVAACRGRVAAVLSNLGREDEAFEIYRAAFEILKGPEGIEALTGAWRQDLAVMAEGAAVILVRRGRPDEALGIQRLVVGALERLVARDPRSGELVHDLAHARSNLAGILRARGELAEAESSLRAGLHALDGLVGREGDHVGWLRLRALGRGNLALILDDQGRRAEALAAARQSLEDFDRLSVRIPGDPALAAERETAAGRVRDLEAAAPPPR